VPTDAILLNGSSSSGKSTIARSLQSIFPEPLLTFGVDSLLEAMPERLKMGGEGIGIGPAKDISVGPTFRAVEAIWIQGIAAMAHAGAKIIVDEVFLGGATSQDRWRAAFDALDVLWVGVHCDSQVLVQRELGRGDRVPGMAIQQAEVVHAGVIYDLEVNTTHASPRECAELIVRQVDRP
jgi:chloramphenicol 3-O phosphotransferase